MPQSEHDQRVDYIEFPVRDIEETKRFYSACFGWEFSDYGPEYTCFKDGRLSGGFCKVDDFRKGGPVVVIYAADLAAAESRIKENGGRIVQKTFEFPGGRRFHFTDPSGHELAVWSES